MANTTNFGWETPDDTDLVKDGAAAMRTLGNAIDTSFVDLKGGTTGQVLSKASNTDLDFTWVAQDDSDAIQNAIVDAKGDLITATAADTPARLAVGTNGQVLTADSTTSTGLKWATAAAGGKVLQVVSSTITTSVNIATTTMTDTNITASITPSATSSKILILIAAMAEQNRSSTGITSKGQLFRGATSIQNYDNYYMGISAGGATSVRLQVITGLSYLDSPSTTSSVTYKLQANCNDTANSGSITFQRDSAPSNITLFEIGA